ncbi:MAG: HAD family hydrolase [Gammaproteobacteria bacterium]|nr:HAD family hydrolase [Gammaproteobacteria bacterium]
MSQPALFLDRDGVINVDHAYVHKKEDFEFIDGIFDLCRKAKELGYLIIVVTNQAGIGRGYYSESDFLKLTDWMKQVFSSENAEINEVYHCPYHPEQGIGEFKKDSELRKPNPGMIFQAAKDYDINLEQSLIIGDKVSDIQAGINAGLGRKFLFTPKQGMQYIKKVKSSAAFSSHKEIIPHLKYRN